jgi:hypothetical protein
MGRILKGNNTKHRNAQVLLHKQLHEFERREQQLQRLGQKKEEE